MPETDQYVHVLLFACPNCDRPLAATCLSTRRNLEIAEAEWFSPHCVCGWSREIAGVTALKHWVESWHGRAVLPGEPGSCEHQSLTHKVR